MHVQLARAVVVVLFLAQTGWVAASGEDTVARYRASTGKPFDEVMADLEFAIAEHNFRVTGKNHIGQALRDREWPDYPSSTVVHFCNVEYARRILEFSRDYFIHMPCRVVVYESADQVIVEALLFPVEESKLKALSDEINAMLKDVVTFAVE